ncbi:MAG: glycosyltransferase family 4 protein [Armatimonadetes bacterium]|nr:glycosyltransferase family 4 protein [Armatimonadota bacterium]
MDETLSGAHASGESAPRSAGAPLRLACIFEHSIGHATFQKNLAGQVTRWPDVTAQWHPLPFDSNRRWPPRRLNWTLRSGLMARQALRGVTADALFFHTQVPALLCPDHLARVPTILSMDATPAQNARLGIYGGAAQKHAPARRLASRWVAWSARKALRVVAWSDWVRRSLIEEYGLEPDRIAVIPPGIDVRLWTEGAGRPPARVGRAGDPVRILFVGGDFRAKGGEVLLECFERFWRRRAELHLVTRTPLLAGPGVVVHRGLAPNSPELVRLFRASDLFVLPTLGDTFAQVLVEAMASGLPVVASDVGALSEVVAHGETGLLVPAGDAESLFAAVEALIQDPELRRQMGAAGWERARDRFDIARNGRRMVELLLAAR